MTEVRARLDLRSMAAWMLLSKVRLYGSRSALLRVFHLLPSDSWHLLHSGRRDYKNHEAASSRVLGVMDIGGFHFQAVLG